MIPFISTIHGRLSRLSPGRAGLAPVVAVALLAARGGASAQTYYDLSAANYSQTFDTIADTAVWVTPATASFSGVAAGGATTIPDPNKLTQATVAFITGSSGGVQRGTANLQLLATGGDLVNSTAIDLNLNSTGRVVGTLSFNAATVFNSTGNRQATLKVFASVDGASWTELTGTNLPYIATNNVEGSAAITATLPTSLNNQPNVRLRFYDYGNATVPTPTPAPSGSRPKISIDDVSVTSTSSGGDSTAPTVVSFAPVDEGVGVLPAAKISVTFSEPVAAGAGSVKLYQSNGTLVQAFAATAATFSGNTATFTPATPLVDGLAYYVLVDATAFKDLSLTPNSFAGISSATTWNFTTVGGPTITAVTPANGATNVSINTDLTIFFNRPVAAGTGNILIKKVSDNSTVESLAVPALDLVDPTDVTIDIAQLVPSTAYYVVVPAGAYTRSDGTGPSSAFGSAATWSFTTAAPDITPPLATTLIPASGTTNASPVGEFRLVMNENVVLGTGNILIKKVSDNTTAATISVGTVSVVDNVNVVIPISTPLALSTAYYIEIPSGLIKDTSGNSFAGFSGAAGWPITTATVPVVINKYGNASPVDVIELLVVGNQTPGTTVNLSGMVIKDHSASMASDGGGKYRFNSGTIWDAVPVGTLIVLTQSGTSDDIVSSDFLLKVSLADLAYFTPPSPTTGALDIATTELVMIKAANSDFAGNAGGFHAFGAGATAAQFTSFGGPKLLAGQTTGTGLVAIALNSTSSLYDFFGTDALAAVNPTAPETPITFGTPNNQTNANYIATLRGLSPSQGNGVASVVNSTVGSPFLNVGMFDRGLSGQSATVTVNAGDATTTLGKVSITVPAILTTTLSSSNVSFSGPGSTGAVMTFSGQTINFTGASITQANSLSVKISGLTTPSPSAVTDDGIYPLTVQTAGAAYTPSAIAQNPAVRVIIPLASIRDSSAGVPADAGKLVAVEGVVTMGNFSTTGTNGTMQDNTGGTVIYSATVEANLVRSHRYAVLGIVRGFRGLAEIEPTAAGNVIDRGLVTDVVPTTVSLATFLASPEAYESMLLKIENLSPLTGETPSWAISANFTLQDSSAAKIEIRTQPGAAAITAPATYPVNVVGVMGQFSTSTTAPFLDNGYQLQPRSQDDITPGTAPVAGYSTWAAANAGGQPSSGDYDGDGIKNGVEYFFGATGSSFTPNPSIIAGKITFPFDPTAVVTSYAIQTSPDLVTWTPVTAAVGTNTVSYTLPTGAGKLFVRLVVVTP